MTSLIFPSEVTLLTLDASLNRFIVRLGGSLGQVNKLICVRGEDMTSVEITVGDFYGASFAEQTNVFIDMRHDLRQWHD